MKLGLKWSALAVLSVSLTACEQPYRIVGEPPPDPDKLICNPLDSQNQVDPRLGLKASLYYIENFVPNGPYPVTTNEEFLTKGVKVDAEMFMSNLDVSPRAWGNGFMAMSGKVVERADGQKLFEWFSIQGGAYFQLTNDDADGFYQLGAMSDDGIYIEVQKADGSWERLLDHQAPHSPQFGCATKAIGLAKGKKIRMRFAYYQGPRYFIAAQMMWRRVADPDNIPAESECFASRSSDYYYDSRVDPPKKLAPFEALESRGWKVLKPGNFLLVDGTNKCVK